MFHQVITYANRSWRQWLLQTIMKGQWLRFISPSQVFGSWNSSYSVVLYPAVCPSEGYSTAAPGLSILAFRFCVQQRQRSRPLTHDTKTSNQQPHEMLSGFTVAEFPPKGLDVWTLVPGRSVESCAVAREGRKLWRIHILITNPAKGSAKQNKKRLRPEEPQHLESRMEVTNFLIRPRYISRSFCSPTPRIDGAARLQWTCGLRTANSEFRMPGRAPSVYWSLTYFAGKFVLLN